MARRGRTIGRGGRSCARPHKGLSHRRGAGPGWAVFPLPRHVAFCPRSVRRHQAGVSRTRHPDGEGYPLRLRASRAGRNLENGGGSERALSRLRAGRDGRLRWLCLIPIARRACAGGRDLRHESVDRPAVPCSRYRSGSWSWHDALAWSFLPAGGMGTPSNRPRPDRSRPAMDRPARLFRTRKPCAAGPHRLRQLRRIAWPASGGSLARSRRAPQSLFRYLRSGDEYDREAITHVMACTSHFPGLFLASEFSRFEE